MDDEKIEKIIEEFLKLNPKVKEEELLWRMDGRLEWTCEHGIGHTVYEPKGRKLIHGGCDRCCEKVRAYCPEEKGEEAEEVAEEYSKYC